MFLAERAISRLTLTVDGKWRCGHCLPDKGNRRICDCTATGGDCNSSRSTRCAPVDSEGFSVQELDMLHRLRSRASGAIMLAVQPDTMRR
jgi:hypothetical protein